MFLKMKCKSFPRHYDPAIARVQTAHWNDVSTPSSNEVLLHKPIAWDRNRIRMHAECKRLSTEWTNEQKQLNRQILLKKLLKACQNHVLLALLGQANVSSKGNCWDEIYLRLWSAEQILYSTFMRMRNWGTCHQNSGDWNGCGCQCGQTWKLVSVLIGELSADESKEFLQFLQIWTICWLVYCLRCVTFYPKTCELNKGGPNWSRMCSERRWDVTRTERRRRRRKTTHTIPFGKQNVHVKSGIQRHSRHNRNHNQA